MKPDPVIPNLTESSSWIYLNDADNDDDDEETDCTTQGRKMNHHETEVLTSSVTCDTENNNENKGSSFIANGIIHQNEHSLKSNWTTSNGHITTNGTNGIIKNIDKRSGIRTKNSNNSTSISTTTTKIATTTTTIGRKTEIKIGTSNSKLVSAEKKQSKIINNFVEPILNNSVNKTTEKSASDSQSVKENQQLSLSSSLATAVAAEKDHHHSVVLQNSAKKFDIHSQRKIQESFEPCLYYEAFFTYFCYAVLVIVGYINDIIRPRKSNVEAKRAGYTQLYASFESFYTRNVYRRVRDSWNIPICSVPGKYVTLVEPVSPDYGWTIQYSENRIECINMGSYNYLGFAENNGPCADDSISVIKTQGISTASTRKELGNTTYLDKLDKLVARFVGTEDAITCSMGFATNALNLPCILNKGCLVISDEKNHASIILGLRTSGATVHVFKHNNMKSLEKKLREGIIKGRPKTGLPWDKIFIVVEGVYSMEGSIVRLPEIVDLKRKYKAYLYLDEAHSIGAVGPRGRGVCDYWGVNPKDVDILMGTFTKSFGSAGGYIAGSRPFIQMLRATSHAHAYGGSMSAPVAEQILSSMKIIMGEDGTNEGVRRIHQLARNARYFRQKLKQLGFVVYGNDDSPVVPVALYMPSKIAFTVREMIKRGVALVGVGFPATPLVEGRIRFCMSASHTKEMLDHVLKEFSDIGESINSKTSRLPRYKGEICYSEV